MKKAEKIIISGFILAVVFSFFGFSVNCEKIPEKVVRLHVLANSNSEYDQRIKLAVKDDISVYAGELMENAHNPQEAEKKISENLSGIEKVANMKLSELGADYKAKVVLEDTFFETRDYDNFSLPAGEYKALRVLIGDGEGENWWCVVYPTLCISSATKEDFNSFSDEEKEIIKKPANYKVSFKVYEWYQDLLNLFQSN